ncbi:unnamed protein product [Diplocarpon coronariae]
MANMITKKTEIETELSWSNFWEWKPTIIQSLATNGCLAWAIGPVPQRPAKSDGKWEEKNQEAIATIAKSLTPMICEKYENDIIANDANALWNAIRDGESKLGNTEEGHMILIKELYEAKYVPYSESLEDYVLRLQNIQTRLQGYDNPPNDSQMKQQMITGLPKAGMWLLIQLQLKHTNKSWQETVIAIQQYEQTYREELKVTPIATQSAALNTEANISRGSRGRGREGRYRGRGNRGRGGIQKGERGGGSHNSGNIKGRKS